MQQHGTKIVAKSHPLPRGWGQKVNIYIIPKVVMLHIELKGIEHKTPWKQMCSFLHTLDSLGGVKRSFFFLESGQVAYQIKVKDV